MVLEIGTIAAVVIAVFAILAYLESIRRDLKGDIKEVRNEFRSIDSRLGFEIKEVRDGHGNRISVVETKMEELRRSGRRSND